MVRGSNVLSFYEEETSKLVQGAHFLSQQQNIISAMTDNRANVIFISLMIVITITSTTQKRINQFERFRSQSLDPDGRSTEVSKPY